MKNLKKYAAILAVLAVSAAAFTACGGQTTAPEAATEAVTEAPTETETEPVTEAETEPETEEETEEASDFSLLDVDSSMIKTGLYATGENGEEIVLSLFEYDDTDYVSLMMFEADGSNDVICGAYTGEVETDEDGIDWTMMSFDDVYTGNSCKVGCAEPDDGTCYIFDMDGNTYEAKYLDADETITYMGAAVAVAAEGEDNDSEDGFSLLDVDSSMIKTGLYATGENGEEIVLSLFEYDNTDYVSLMMFEADGSNDVICGAYTGEVETDEDGIDWTMMSFDDVYTGNSCKVGCAEPDDGTCYIFDMDGNTYEAKYLDADETITYMGAAVAVSTADAD